MTITEQDMEFFKEAKRIQELWEPRPGDCCVVKSEARDYIYLVSVPPYSGGPLPLEDALTLQCIHSNLNFGVYEDATKIKEQEAIIWLPRQGQLQEMLEERGYDWLLDKDTATTRTQDSLYHAILFHGGRPIGRLFVAPTPPIALGKCLLEVLKEEQG